MFDDTTVPPVHPGEVLRVEFLTPLKITPYRLAKEIGMSRPAVNDLCLGRQAVTWNMAVRIGRFFGTSARFWVNLQALYDERMVVGDEALQAALASITPLAEANGESPQA